MTILQNTAFTLLLPANMSRDLPANVNDYLATVDRSSAMQGLNCKEIIANSEPRQWINLSNQQLTIENLAIVAQRAVIEKQCRVLDLGNNNITAQGVSIIYNALHNCTNIERLYLRDNQIGDTGVEQLSLLVETLPLIVLGLSRNGITDLGAQHLAQMLQKNRYLIVLGLEDNEISDRGVELLANALKHNRTLQRMLLAGNKIISDSIINPLVDMLQYNQSLKKLDLRRCQLSYSVKMNLQEVVRTKRHFELLY